MRWLAAITLLFSLTFGANSESLTDAAGLSAAVDLFETNTAPIHYPQLAVPTNPSVRRWMRTFLADGGVPFRSLLVRAYSYKPMVERVFGDEGIPSELFYLGLIESGYTPEARSARGALGIWQFTPGTAAIYGLNRRATADPCRSTRAAARHLAHLYDRFGSWPLAIAAYNAGESRLQNALTRARSRNYWVIAKRRLLPAQTLQYVPKFLAAVAVGENLERYGVDAIEPIRYRQPTHCPVLD